MSVFERFFNTFVILIRLRELLRVFWAFGSALEAFLGVFFEGFLGFWEYLGSVLGVF